MNIGLLLLRVVVGGLFVGHGCQKLFGWFGGHGPRGTAGFFSSLGYRRPELMALVAAVAETTGGTLLALGLLTPVASAAIAGVMLNAIVAVHLRNGLWVTSGGFEYPLVLATVAVALAFTGPGAFSVDAVLDLTLGGVRSGLLALVLGVVSAAGALSLRRRPVAAEDRDLAEAA